MNALQQIIQQTNQQIDTTNDPSQRFALQMANFGNQVGQVVGQGLGWGANEIQQAIEHLANPGKITSKSVLQANAKIKSSPTVTPQPIRVTPTPTQATQKAIQTAYQPNIMIPDSQTGLPRQVDPAIAQILLNSFNATGQATNAAQVLSHPASNSFISTDPLSNDHINHGENASFRTGNIDATNYGGSVDRGLMRINSQTFSDWMNNPNSKSKLAKLGINSFEDMNDPQKNANFANLLQQSGGWERWFAAPRNLRLGRSKP